MTWTAPVPPPFVDGPLVGDDRPMVEAYLAWHRYTLMNICAGLTGAQLATRSIPPSGLSLLGLVRHLAKVERTWLRERIAAQRFEPMYPGAVDTDFDDLDADAAEADFERYADECRLADAAVRDVPFDHTIDHGGETMSLRFVYLHLIEEYARHCGHADLLRERIDGRTNA